MRRAGLRVQPLAGSTGARETHRHFRRRITVRTRTVAILDNCHPLRALSRMRDNDAPPSVDISVTRIVRYRGCAASGIGGGQDDDASSCNDTQDRRRPETTVAGTVNHKLDNRRRAM